MMTLIKTQVNEVPRNELLSRRRLLSAGVVVAVGAVAGCGSATGGTTEQSSSALKPPSPTSTAVPPTPVPPVTLPSLTEPTDGSFWSDHFDTFLDSATQVLPMAALAVPGWGLAARAGLALTVAVGGRLLADHISDVANESPEEIAIHEVDKMMSPEFPKAPLGLWVTEGTSKSLYHYRESDQSPISGCAVVHMGKSGGGLAFQMLEEAALLAVAVVAVAICDHSGPEETRKSVWPTAPLENTMSFLSEPRIRYGTEAGEVTIESATDGRLKITAPTLNEPWTTPTSWA